MSAALKIIYVPREHLQTVWTAAQPHLQKAAERSGGRYEAEDIAKDIAEDKQLLWVVWDAETEETLAAMTTQIVNYPRKKILRIPFIGGERMNEWWPEFYEAMCKYAKDCGASGIEGAGRKGWARQCSGMREEGVILIKDLAA